MRYSIYAQEELIWKGDREQEVCEKVILFTFIFLVENWLAYSYKTHTYYV